MTAIASRNPFDLLSEDGEPRAAPLTAVKTKGAASTASPAVNLSAKSNTSAAAAQVKPKGDNSNNNNNRSNNNQRSNNNNSNNKTDQRGERKPYVQRTPGPATGEGAIYEKFPKGTGSPKNASGQAARGPRAGRGGRANNDRHSNTGRRENEKRNGAGNANWGNEEQDMHKLEHLDTNNASEALKEYAEGETGLDANGETITPAEKEEEEEPQLTLEEYKAQLAAKKNSSALPAARVANSGKAIKGVTSKERKEQEDFFVGKAEKAKKEKAAKEVKAKQFLEIEQKFNEAPRPPRGEGMDRRNSRGRGGSRGGSFGGRGGRGGNASGRGGRGGHNKANAAPGADLNDDKSFPSLQR